MLKSPFQQKQKLLVDKENERRRAEMENRIKNNADIFNSDTDSDTPMSTQRAKKEKKEKMKRREKEKEMEALEKAEKKKLSYNEG